MRNVYQAKVKNLDEAFAMILERAKQKTVNISTHIAIAHTFCANASVSESDRFANVGGSVFGIGRCFFRYAVYSTWTFTS